MSPQHLGAASEVEFERSSPRSLRPGSARKRRVLDATVAGGRIDSDGPARSYGTKLVEIDLLRNGEIVRSDTPSLSTRSGLTRSNLANMGKGTGSEASPSGEKKEMFSSVISKASSVTGSSGLSGGRMIRMMQACTFSRPMFNGGASGGGSAVGSVP